MPTTPRGLVYPDSADHTRLWEHFAALATSTDDALDDVAVPPDSGWQGVSYGNGFSAYTALGWAGISVRRVSGLCVVTGAATRGSAWTDGLAICNLPSGYRPDRQVQGVACRVEPGGNVLTAGSGSGATSVLAVFPAP